MPCIHVSEMPAGGGMEWRRVCVVCFRYQTSGVSVLSQQNPRITPLRNVMLLCFAGVLERDRMFCRGMACLDIFVRKCSLC